MRKALTIAKINLRWPKIPILMTPIIFFAQFISIYIQYLVGIKGASSVSLGNIAFIHLISVAVIVPWYNFERIMHLGGKKKDFFIGTYFTYIILAVILSTFNTVIHLTVDKVLSSRIELYNLIDIFKWTNDGMAFSTVRMFAFVLLISVIIHTLSALQTQKIGWIIDIGIIVILSVMIPIAQLRTPLVKIISLFTFADNGWEQIILCVLLSALVYMLNIFALRNKRI